MWLDWLQGPTALDYTLMSVFGANYKAKIERFQPECHPQCYIVDDILVPHCDCLTHGNDWRHNEDD